jgi:hypothetical protein
MRVARELWAFLRGRTIRLHDAQGRLSILPIDHATMRVYARHELWTVGAVVLLGSAGLLFFKVYVVLPFFCLGVFGVLVLSARSRAFPFAREFARAAISNDACPICAAPLYDRTDRMQRRCMSCHGVWWDVPGIEAGTSPRQHVRRRVGYTFVAVVGGLLYAAWGFGVARVANPECSLVGFLFLAALCFATAEMVVRNFVYPLVLPSIVALGPLVLILQQTSTGVLNRLPLSLAIAAALVGVTYLGARRGLAKRPKDILVGRGHTCADCTYDLTATAEGHPCPECGSSRRIR